MKTMKKLLTLLLGMCVMVAFSCSSDNENNEVKSGNCFKTTRVDMNCVIEKILRNR